MSENPWCSVMFKVGLSPVTVEDFILFISSLNLKYKSICDSLQV